MDTNIQVNTDKANLQAGCVRAYDEFPEPRTGHVYVLTVPNHYSMQSKVIAVFKRAQAMERFFKGAMLSQIRYYGHRCPLNEVRGWYTVTERKVEG